MQPKKCSDIYFGDTKFVHYKLIIAKYLLLSTSSNFGVHKTSNLQIIL
jgi:hypothetical protein